LTHDAVEAIQSTRNLRVAAHLTCVDASKAETLEIASHYASAGVRDIVALRGDAPKGHASFAPHPDGFSGSVDLISALAETENFNILVGAYPEIHPDARDADADITHLKAKLDAGASGAITQFFFEADTFLRFRDRCAKAGIDAPITPGILPIENWEGVKRFAANCGAQVPQILGQAFENAARDGTTDLLATAVAAELCDTLTSEGVPDLHFYTLNRPDLTAEVCKALGITPKPRLQNVA
jgi:methylenetetrahydrofolate reductase (NADPH)